MGWIQEEESVAGGYLKGDFMREIVRYSSSALSLGIGSLLILAYFVGDTDDWWWAQMGLGVVAGLILARSMKGFALPKRVGFTASVLLSVVCVVLAVIGVVGMTTGVNPVTGTTYKGLELILAFWDRARGSFLRPCGYLGLVCFRTAWISTQSQRFSHYSTRRHVMFKPVLLAVVLQMAATSSARDSRIPFCLCERSSENAPFGHRKVVHP